MLHCGYATVSVSTLWGGIARRDKRWESTPPFSYELVSNDKTVLQAFYFYFFPPALLSRVLKGPHWVKLSHVVLMLYTPTYIRIIKQHYYLVSVISVSSSTVK